jgi:hypothetical protein
VVNERSRYWLLVVALLAWTSTARAHEGSGYTPDVSDLPPSPLKRQILEVERRVKQGKHRAELVKQPLGDALRAVERARGARERERKAAAEAKRARELTVKVQRAEALLTEQHARVGRLQAEVKGLEQKVKGDAQRTKDKERERIEKAPTAPPKPKKKPVTP